MSAAQGGAAARGGGRQPGVGQGEEFGRIQVEDVVRGGQAVGVDVAAPQRQGVLARGGKIGHQYAARGLALPALDAGSGQQTGDQRALPER
ncbi:hypothetical protein LMG3410_06462 [Achromobacter aegrifaciens]|nr:hypothetical protein LMG3410_06462 [Achromobacter aegrifaciens]